MDLSTVGGIELLPVLRSIYSGEASISFYIPLDTATFFHEYQKLPADSIRLTLHRTLTLPLTLSWKHPWKLAFQLPWKSDGSTCTLSVASTDAGAICMSYFHGSRF